MREIQLIKGNLSDREWLYNLYKKTMRSCIEATWGWNEEFQSNGFNENLTPTKWKIIRINNEGVGGFILTEKIDHLWLEIIILKPEYQHKGIGRRIMLYIQSIAKEKTLPLRLSVIKLNPVKPFYLKLGFNQYDEDVSLYILQWCP